ncbi:hypothetical protein [Salmonella enterica]
MTAAYYGTQAHQDIAEFLLLHGADINKNTAYLLSHILNVHP